MSIVLQGSTSGSITLQEPAVAGSTVLSLPATTGTVLTSASPSSDLPSSINGPAFSAYQSTLQSTSNSVATKIQFQTEEFDTANCFDSTTNYRFTPNVAGYYQVNGCLGYANQSVFTLVWIYKNGSVFKRGTQSYSSASASQYVVSALVYLNGSTDYIELYGIQASGGSLNTEASQQNTYFQAFLARAA